MSTTGCIKALGQRELRIKIVNYYEGMCSTPLLWTEEEVAEMAREDSEDKPSANSNVIYVDFIKK